MKLDITDPNNDAIFREQLHQVSVGMMLVKDSFNARDLAMACEQLRGAIQIAMEALTRCAAIEGMRQYGAYLYPGEQIRPKPGHDAEAAARLAHNAAREHHAS